MISQHAKESFERIFQKAARTRLPVEAGDSCEIVAAGEGTVGPERAENVVVLTISSIVFRMLLVLHFDEDTTTRDYFVRNEEGAVFREVFLEICNLCCGAMNQELLNYFPDLGMSTPYVLSAHCLPHLDELKPGYLASFAVTINGSVRLGATVCVCADAPLDFIVEVNAVEETGGELELF
ncbi:hypothetical protein [Paraburkholderia saeva]|uniref:Uncharacterized protein n=1 Tax=Paraburkholderia saeva TaxID=2777537 RepID=A0A9N8X0L3_9BURK|nr:hypothetical protein [Paraburkholderia saeva]CAG4894436.1 hypothetical protein LMG31841_01914 [Paraburkholderia saeva]CAG4898904.1 hypothetical protein R70241_02543 [Paraburkholderia saeva]